MSVVPMKLITLTGPLAQFDGLMDACLTGLPFQPENTLSLLRDVAGLRPCDTANPYAAPLRRVEVQAERLGVALTPCPAGAPPALDELTAWLDELTAQEESLRARREELQRDTRDKQAAVGRLENLRGLEAHVEDLRSFQYLRFRYGHLPRETYDSFRAVIEAREDVLFFPLSTARDAVHAVYLTTAAAHDDVDAFFISLHFARVLLDEHIEGSPDEAIARLTNELAQTEQESRDISARLTALTAGAASRLCAAQTFLARNSALCALRRSAACAKDAFYLTGWLPADAMDALTSRLAPHTQVSFVADDAADVTLATPPTKLKNNFFARIYEPYLRMYGLPSYREFDPSLLMALTYTLFFGIMFGDVGQGLCLALFGFALWHWKKLWLGNILVCCGLSGALFGCVYGSVFGFEHLLPGFKILEGNHVTILLVLSMALGGCMIVLSMCMNIANGVRQRNVEKILFGSNALAGMVFYLGLAALAVCALTGYADLMHPAYILPVLVLPLLLIWLREPLALLLTNPHELRHLSIGGMLGTGFFEVFETLLSYLTNTLSFMRIGAYAVTHVCLMQVVHMLAGSGNVAVIIAGNLFVMGLEGLLVSIQVLRLEFYELFGRFYEDGGVEFKPFGSL